MSILMLKKKRVYFQKFPKKCLNHKGGSTLFLVPQHQNLIQESALNLLHMPSCFHVPCFTSLSLSHWDSSTIKFFFFFF